MPFFQHTSKEVCNLDNEKVFIKPAGVIALIIDEPLQRRYCMLLFAGAVQEANDIRETETKCEQSHNIHNYVLRICREHGSI